MPRPRPRTRSPRARPGHCWVSWWGSELLPDWYDDWVLPERERLEQLRVKALERIARQALEAGDLELSVDAARAATDVDPLLEWAGELAIRAHLGRGDLGSALLEFDRYRDAVRDELGVPPSRAIRELIEPALTESRIALDSQREEVPEVAALTRPAAATPAVPMDSQRRGGAGGRCSHPSCRRDPGRPTDRGDPGSTA